MVTKEEIKKEIDRLPENLLTEVYDFLQKVLSTKKTAEHRITLRNFKGKLDNINTRKAAYE